jgi:lipid A 3-O-deacylase
MNSKATISLALFFAGSAVAPVLAQANDPNETRTNPPVSERGAFTILFENDLFYNSDHDYTNGVQFAYTTAPGDTPRWAVDVARSLPFFAQTGDVRARYALGQDIFTPHNLSLANPPLTDRPYAGFLYVALGLVDDNGTDLDQLQVTLGVVGPASLAEETQKLVHSIFNDRKPMGWSTQLRDEPGLIIEYNRSIKLIEPQSVLGGVFDIEPNYGAAIGNVYDYAEVGAMGRFGFNLPKDYGPMRISPSLPASDYFEPTSGLGAYVFAGVEGRAIARNLFLDGNSFERSRSVVKMNLVGDLVLGAAITFDSFRLAFTHDIRTHEYKTQPAADQFGAVDLTFRF